MFTSTFRLSIAKHVDFPVFFFGVITIRSESESISDNDTDVYFNDQSCDEKHRLVIRTFTIVVGHYGDAVFISTPHLCPENFTVNGFVTWLIIGSVHNVIIIHR